MVHILIVDDSRLHGKCCVAILESLGHTVLNPPAEWTPWNNTSCISPRLCSLTCIMEEMSGFEVLRNLLHYDAGRGWSLRLLTSKDPLSKKRCGASVVINKPLERAVVLRCMRR
jgi:DNA-binding response OmpR family regulator